MRVDLPKYKSRSLRRRALSVRAQLEGETRRARLLDTARRFGSKLIRDYRWSSLVLAVPCFGAAFLPIPWSFRPFEAPRVAVRYLTVLWQVEAAALGLTLVVVVFILQAVHTRKQRPALRDLAEKIWLPLLFYSGLFGIGLIAVVLLGGGHGAPGGWAASWALLWAVLPALGLINLFIQMLHAIEPERLYRQWLESIEQEMYKYVEADVLRRIAYRVLKEVCEDNEVQLVGLLGSSLSPNLEPVTASRAGTVTDIILRRVRRAGLDSKETRVAETHGGDTPVICVTLGDRVGEAARL